METIKIGIMPQEMIRARTMAIARGEYKPKPSEPKIWLTSIRSLVEVLSDENHAPLKIFIERKPDSLTELPNEP